MARIKTYKLDDNVTGSDMWIGTDGNDASKTKNFSPTYLANYLNQNEVIDVANSIRFTYDTIDSGKSRKSGTLSFATEIGAVVPINSITTFILSKNTQSTKLVNAFLNILPGTKIILQKSDYINIFGIFKVISVTQITLEPDFYTVVVEYISGYGSLEEDKDYIISLIDLQGGNENIPTKTSDLTNDGEDGVNPFITLEDLPPSASTLTEVLFNGNETLGYNIKVNDSDAIELENGSLIRKGTYDFGGFGDVIVSGITNNGDGYIASVMGWGDPAGTLWSDLNGTYIKTSIAVTPLSMGSGDIGMHTPEPGTFNYYLELISNPTFNGIAYFLAPGNKSGWGDPDNDATTDTPVNYWRLCVLSDYPYVYFTNPSSDPYNFPTSGWVPIDDTIPNSEGGNGYTYIANYGGGFTASISNTLNGNGGISRICSVGYEDMWQAGIRYVFGNNGTIRHATNGFTVIPDSSFDYTKRFAIGSLWTLDNGDTYECTNADLNAAVWVLKQIGVTNLDYVPEPTQGTVTSDAGDDAIIPLADETNAGLLSPSEKVKIEDSVPYTGATQDVDLGLFDITAAHIIKDGGQPEQFLKADGSVDNNTYLTSADLPSTLDLYATTTVSDIPTYGVLVRNIADGRFNTTAVDVTTPVISGIAIACGSLITDPNIISGNPGVFNFTLSGNIRKISGPTASQAEFYFRIYKRVLAGTETLISESAKVLIPNNSGTYALFTTVALWNDGIFLDTDRIVLKFYGDLAGTGSGGTYQFQFGGISPVRGSAAIPTAVLPNIYLKDLADVENVDALNNEVLYWNDTASLWEHSLVTDLIPDATAIVRGLLNSTDWNTFNNKQNASTRRNANNSANSNINYCGVALGTGVSDTASVWTIKRLIITAEGVSTTTTAITVRWVDRETATYT